MSPTELIHLTAADTASKVASGEVSAVEVAQAHLDRITAVDERVHAFLHVDTAGALADESSEFFFKNQIYAKLIV